MDINQILQALTRGHEIKLRDGRKVRFIDIPHNAPFNSVDKNVRYHVTLTNGQQFCILGGDLTTDGIEESKNVFSALKSF